MVALVCARDGCEQEFRRVTCQKYCSVDCRSMDKRCTKCREPIPNLSGTKNRLCRGCDAERARDYRKGEQYKQRWLGQWRLRNYGLSERDHARMVEEQRGVCAICDEPETAIGRSGTVKPLAVDHDHDTGAIRGLLCQRCNAGIGFMNHDLKRLEAAMQYLEWTST